MKLNLQSKLKCVFALVAILSIENIFAQVTLPHYDGFDYTVGQGLQTQTGWTTLNSGDDIAVATGNLSNSGLPATTGNKITFAGAGIDTAKSFTAQSVGFGTVYFSFLLNVTALGSLNTTGGYFTGINDTASNFASTVWLKSDGLGGYQIGINPRTTAANTAWGVSRSLNTTYMVVISLTSATGLANDISKIWVDPVLNGTEPTAIASVTNAGTDLTSINRILLRQDAATTTPSIELDELRIGLSFESVTANVWNGTAWTNGAPTGTTNALINGNFGTTANGAITAKNLIVEGAGALTVNSGTGITVNENIINKLTADKFIVQNNANILQSANPNANVGNITVNRNSTPMVRLDYTFWSSPVAGQNLLGFSPNTLTNRFYDYDEAANNFTNVGLPTNFVAGKGYSVRAPNDYTTTPTTFNGAFVGIPNTGTIAVPVTFSDVAKGYNFVGNPYPTPLNISDFLMDTSTVQALYFWTHSTQAVGAGSAANYATVNRTGPSSSTATAATGGAQPNGFIQTGQGFIVKVNTTGNILFTNSMRTANFDNQFFRTSTTNTITNTTERNRIWMNVADNSGVLNQTMIGYVPNATNALDGQYDATLLENNGTRLYSVINNDAYVIQGRALPFANNDTVALGFRTDIAGSYTISIAQVDGLFSGNQDIFLFDNLTGISHNLKTGDYTFVSNAGTFNARFKLVYQTVLNVVTPTLESGMVVFVKNENINITSTVAMSAVKVFDLAGRLIFEKSGINTNNIELNELRTAHQVLLVQVTADGKTATTKIVY